MRYVQTQQGRIALWERGRGEPWLLVHGFPLDHTMWDPLAERLAQNVRILAPDLVGFGASGALPPGPATMGAFADSLAELLVACGIDGPVTLVGLSMGGYIGLAFYRRHPERVGRMVLCDTRAASDTPEARARREATARRVLEAGTPQALVETLLPQLFAAKTQAAHPEVVEATARVMRATAPATIAAALRGMAERPDHTELLPELTCRVLYVAGSEDALTPPSEMAAMAEATPQGTFAAIEGAGHMAPLEQPDRVYAVIEAWRGGSPET